MHSWALRLLALVVLLGGCAPPPATLVLDPTPTPTPFATGSLAEPLAAAYALTEPDDRREAVLAATAAYLRQTDLPVEEAASAYNEAAGLTGEEGILLQRYGDLLLAGLPRGIGLVLLPPQGDPVPISRWTVDMSIDEVRLQPGEIGIIYRTAAADGSTHIHFVLAGQRGDSWRVLWHSDEAPDWWFNARNARIAVGNDLQQLYVVGEAPNATTVFDETLTPLYRAFGLRWVRTDDTYTIEPAPEGYPSRLAWLWESAWPSPYATLVEFIERLRIGDVGAAETLTVGETVVQRAQAFGLDASDRLFVVTGAEDDTITFRDVNGAFTATFEEGTWLITDVRPLGAPAPTTTPTPATTPPTPTTTPIP